MRGCDPMSRDEVQRLAEASAWRVALSEAGQLTSDAFEAWIADPANEAAWDQVQHSWNLVGDQASSPEILTLRRDALERAGRFGATSGAAGRWLPRIAACLIVMLGLGIAWSSWISREAPLSYATTLGERRVVTLADGSKVSLDSNSELRIAYSDDARKLVLMRGQARFDVAHDVTRPFSVQARDRIVVATGTAFNVDLMGDKVQVTLIEGRVVVLTKSPAPAGAAAPAPAKRGIALTAGQQLTVAPRAAGMVETVNLDRATAWESGQLVFEDEPLGSIAERISRYSAHPVRVAPAIAPLKISGVFNAGDVATFADTVSRYLPVEAATQGDGSVLLKPAR